MDSRDIVHGFSLICIGIRGTSKKLPLIVVAVHRREQQEQDTGEEAEVSVGPLHLHSVSECVQVSLRQTSTHFFILPLLQCTSVS